MTALADRVESDRWADLAPPGRPGVRARVAEAFFRRAVRRLPVRVELPDGTTLGAGGPDSPRMVLHRPDDFHARVGADALIGFGESYLAGDYDSPDLAAFLTELCTELTTLVPAWMQRLRSCYVAHQPRGERNVVGQSRGNVARHYDLSNAMFAAFLDETMTYSCALFADQHESLAGAQRRKIDRLLDAAGVRAGTRVLEIGTGWGELAIRAAARGASVRSVTLSTEQLELARDRVAAAGYADRVRIDLLDYREVTGQYDAVVSVEMIEAVGREFWPTYFRTIDDLLAPGGAAAIQAITMPHDRMLATRNTWTWINKYIFPGGFLPSTEAIEQVTREHTSLRVTDRLSIGTHYVRTLREWDTRFAAAHDRIAELGFDPTFERMWHFYLAYSEAGFAAGYLDVQQVVLRRPGADGTAGSGVAARLEGAVGPFVGGDLPVRLHAWDGSVAGPARAPMVRLNGPAALRRLLWHPGELGAAQAYVTGELEVDGDLAAALSHVWRAVQERRLGAVRRGPGVLLRLLRTARAVGALGAPPAPPTSQARVRGRLHSLARDRSAISHHYDLSNEFYSLILDPQMAYSSAYWSRPDMTLEEAQRAKLDLVCDKLGLRPGMRLLDVGCGWGSLSLHAAREYGVRVTGVTLSAEQKRFIDGRIHERGLQDLVEIRLQDYRALLRRGSDDGDFDAVASLEMGEHVGRDNYPTYVEVLRRNVHPGGCVLVQQMSRRGRHPGGGPFIESFIAPDMHMRPLGETVALLERGGLEVRGVQAMREHYVPTVARWLARFEDNRERLRELVGEEVLRVWRLYLVGGGMAFRDGRMGVDQILARR